MSPSTGRRSQGAVVLPAVIVLCLAATAWWLTLWRTLPGSAAWFQRDLALLQADTAAESGWRWALTKLNDDRPVNARCEPLDPVAPVAGSSPPRSVADRLASGQPLHCRWHAAVDERPSEPAPWVCQCDAGELPALPATHRWLGGFALRLSPGEPDGLEVQGCGSGLAAWCHHWGLGEALRFGLRLRPWPGPNGQDGPGWAVVVGSWRPLP